jgi:hypothetical protein
VSVRDEASQAQPSFVSVAPQPQPSLPVPPDVATRSETRSGSIVITGLPLGATLSAGQAVGDDGWRVTSADLDGLIVKPPPGFVGTMDLVVEFRRVDDITADRKQLRLEWVQSKQP